MSRVKRYQMIGKLDSNNTVARDMSAVTVAFLTVALVWSVRAVPACFPEVGCFSMSYPWVSRFRQAKKPLPPTELPVSLDFYSREVPDGLFGVDLKTAPMKRSRLTAIITHDHEDDGNALWMRTLKDGYLEQIDANVVLMDWSSGTVGFGYEQAAANIRVIGRVTAQRLWQASERHGLSPKDFHLIGEGLGAHLMGYIAKNFHGIGRVTGLDPTRKYFEYFDSQIRLDKSDAKFVDVIHTSSRLLLPNTGIGLSEPIGQVDFYVNIGEFQPGCKPFRHNRTNEVRERVLMNNTKSDECNHKKAREYFTQAVWQLDNCTFWGYKHRSGRIFERFLISKRKNTMPMSCTPATCTPLGLGTSKRPARGTFFVRTRHTSPYCIPERITPPPLKPRHLSRGMMNSLFTRLTDRHHN